MKSLLALGIIVLLPLLAIFTLVYFGIHGFRSRFSAEGKTVLRQSSISIFRRETAPVQ